MRLAYSSLQTHCQYGHVAVTGTGNDALSEARVDGDLESVCEVQSTGKPGGREVTRKAGFICLSALTGFSLSVSSTFRLRFCFSFPLIRRSGRRSSRGGGSHSRVFLSVALSGFSLSAFHSFILWFWIFFFSIYHRGVLVLSAEDESQVKSTAWDWR